VNIKKTIPGNTSQTCNDIMIKDFDFLSNRADQQNKTNQTRRRQEKKIQEKLFLFLNYYRLKRTTYVSNEMKGKLITTHYQNKF
jgi:hypothetical protein